MKSLTLYAYKIDKVTKYLIIPYILFFPSMKGEQKFWLGWLKLIQCKSLKQHNTSSHLFKALSSCKGENGEKQI